MGYINYEQEVVFLQVKLNGIMSLIKEERELLGLEPGQSSLDAIRGLLKGCSEKEQVIEEISEDLPKKPIRKKRKSVFSKQERKVIIQELTDLGIKFNARASTSALAKKWVEYLEGKLVIDIETYKDTKPQARPTIEFSSDESPYDCSAPKSPDKEPEKELKDKSPYDLSESDEPADIAFLRKEGHL